MCSHTILIVGLGSVGRRHLRNLEALGHSDLVLLRSGRATLPDADLPAVPVVRDVASAVALRPRAAVIATPTSLHLESAIPLARAGCHLLLEKPVSHSMEGVQDLIETAHRSHARIMMAFQYRHHPGLKAVYQWVHDGAIGRAVSARAHYGDYLPAWHPWEDYRQSYSARADLGGGVLLTLCHPLDYLTWIFGRAVRVSGILGHGGGLEIDVEDTVECVLECSNGVLASVHLDFVQQPPQHTLTVIGTAGTITWDQASGAARLHRPDGRIEVADVTPSFDRNDMFLAEMKTFLDVVDGTATPEPSLADGVHVMNIVFAVRESDRTGRRVDL